MPSRRSQPVRSPALDPSRADFLTRAHMAAPPLSVTRAAAPDHLQQQQGHGGAGRRAAKTLMFLAAVALPCLVL